MLIRPRGDRVVRYLTYLAAWLGLALIVVTFTARDLFSYYRLRRNGILVEGVAVARAPHDQVKYSFQAGGSEYQSVGMTGFGTPPSERISIGDRLPVYYLPKDPKVNCLGSPREIFSNELPPVLLAVILFPSMIIAVAVFRYERRIRRLSKG
jgi:hypothetical protein